MYFNVFGEKVSRRRYREMLNAAKNRRELIAAGLTSRRELMKMGLLTAGGMLVAKSGLSARAYGQQIQTNNPPSSGQNTSPGTNQNCVPGNQTASPTTKPFIDPLPIMPLAKTVSSLTPTPTENPNVGAGEVRAAPFQAPQIDSSRFPVVPATLYNFNQRQFTATQTSDHGQFSGFQGLPQQTLWGFDDGTGTRSPGPTYQAFYGRPQITRNINSLPPITQLNNTGFGFPSVTTHLHNGHTPSESDGNPCDFYTNGHFCDQYYPNVLAGFNSDHAPNGDINEALSTLWYHDHRVDFTSQNTYKGLFGFYCLFNQFDTGNDETGFRLPSFPAHDIPLAFNDKVYDPLTGDLVFDLFNLDGILGDKFLVNGVIQPFLQVEPRRYRFRLLDTGPSRFYEFFLTDLNNLSQANPYWLIGTDGNLLPHPIQVQSVRIGPAERVDVIIDFRSFAGKTIYLENRLNQLSGQGPAAVDSQVAAQNSATTECSLVLNSNQPAILPAGSDPRNLLLQFRVSPSAVTDNSVDPATNPTFYQLPDTTAAARIVRTFKFDRLNGQWSVNGQFMDCNTFRFAVRQNSVEHWLLTNLTGDWTHPIHIHLEEHQILNRNRSAPTVPADLGRKDVTQVHPNERVELFFRFRDWLGKYPIHCHNVVHEDHAMMALWHVVPAGQEDNILVP
ncbi:MAG TPA: multicopper oxidase domain-containing protein [Verrucomicrobiae bacterium]|jgi:FtsP/CotA-like multicopper oxidase with cupredoxin domain|nr:multicopper oxidase domain-containing protein [Verrucomicrobiae bacterium]